MFVCQLEETQQKTSATENNERKKRRGGRLTNVRHGSQAGLLGLSSRGGSNLGNLLFDPSGGDRLGSLNGQAVDAVPQETGQDTQSARYTKENGVVVLLLQVVVLQQYTTVKKGKG